MDKVKKPFYKRWWFYVIVAIVIIGAFNQPSEEDRQKEKAAEEAKEKEKAERIAEIERELEENKRAGEEAEKAREEAAKITIDSVKISSKEFKDLVKRDFSIVTDVKQTDGIVVVTFDKDKTYWSENTMVTETANTGVELMEYLFSNKHVKSVDIVVPTKMLDTKGNESFENVIKVTWDRKISNSVNYSNFKNMVIVEPARFYNEAVSYSIHPGIFAQLKDKVVAGFN